MAHDLVRGRESGIAGRPRGASSAVGRRLAADTVPLTNDPQRIGKQKVSQSRAARKQPAAPTEAPPEKEVMPPPPPEYAWKGSQEAHHTVLSALSKLLTSEQIPAKPALVSGLLLHVSRAARREKAGGWFPAAEAGPDAVLAEAGSSAAATQGLVEHVPSEAFVQAQTQAFIQSVVERAATKHREQQQKRERLSEADSKGNEWREGVKKARQEGRDIVWQNAACRTVPALSLEGKGHWRFVEEVRGLKATGPVYVVVRPYAEPSEGGRRPTGPRFSGSAGAGTFRGTPAEWRAKYQKEAPECNADTPENVTEWGRDAQEVWSKDPCNRARLPSQRKQNPAGTARLEQVVGYAPLEMRFAVGNTANGGIFSGTVPACPAVTHAAVPVPHVTLHFTPVTRGGARLTCALVSSCPASCLASCGRVAGLAPSTLPRFSPSAR